MQKRYVVELTPDEGAQLNALVRQGRAHAREIQHTQILLNADSGSQGSAWTDQQIASTLQVGMWTVERIRQRQVENGLEDAPARRNRAAPNRAMHRNLTTFLLSAGRA